jgi:hypothetical protein
MEAMNCKACRIEIEESETRESLSAEARLHAETCLPCRTARDEHLSLRRLIGSLEAVAAPPDFDLRLRARLAATEGESNRRPAWLLLAPGSLTLAGVAASLVLAILAAVVYRQARLDQPGPTRPAVVSDQGSVRVKDSDAGREAVASNSNRTEGASSTGDPTAPQNHPSENLPATLGTNNRGPHILINRPFSPVARRDAVASGSGNRDINSYESGLSPTAPLITPPGVYNPVVDPERFIALPVRTSNRPVTFLLKGLDGTPHAVPLKLVTFGSEKLIEQNEATGAFTFDASDIW